MGSSARSSWQRALAALVSLAAAALLSACGGGGVGDPVVATPPAPAANTLEALNASTSHQLVLNAVPAEPAASAAAGSVRIHYHRDDGVYTGWHTYVYNAPGEALGGWPGAATPSGTDSYGVYWDVSATSAAFNFIMHKDGVPREPSNWSGASADQQQLWTVATGAEFWKKAGDPVNYTSNPLTAGTPDIKTVRVHYKRYDGDYAPWGVHIWAASGIDVAGLKPGVAIDQWTAPVAFGDFNNPSTGDSEVVFDIPVLNPKDDATRTNLQFIIHGTPSNPNGGSDNKDGRNDNIRINYADLIISGQVGHAWLVQQDATTYASEPDLRAVSTTDARAVWLNKKLMRWPHVNSAGSFKLYHSAQGQVLAVKDSVVSGADGSLALDVFTGTVPAAAALRFKYVDSAGVLLAVKDADVASLGMLHKSQLVVVQEDAAGKVQNATTLQVAGALDDLYPTARDATDYGVKIAGGNTSFKLWAPTAQNVSLALYNAGSGNAYSLDGMAFDATTGAWNLTRTGDLSGKYYIFVVDVFVRGVGLVRNLVTDPNSIGLTTDSRRSYIADLGAAALKPANWDASAPPAKVVSPVDMVIYELHVRDFSINDSTVSSANRGKFTAFTETGSNGMKHLKALSDAGLTDVHLLPIYDLASIPEAGCVAPAISGAADSEEQQAAVAAVKDTDCFNWGYDPYHYTALEGSYATDAADGATRIREFRQMVMALHAAGLRVGMDVVYNHTFASGQNAKSVLDRVVPGYYHRLNAAGSVETSTCCANTATENTMMAKLMSDSVLIWTTQYKIDSFRFDLMGHQPRSVMEDIKARLKLAAGHDVHLLGEGWNFGEVAGGARFEQASQLSLNGSGIGTFSDRARDAARGGGFNDSGTGIVQKQGFINGLFYDDNGSAAGRTLADLQRAGDMIRSGLAGSIRDFSFHDYLDASRQLQQIDYNGQPAGFVTDPSEVVNYVENHDNQTLFDINVYKLPVATSADDRARVQMLGAAVNAFSQGVSYFHAGVDTLRSKSMDQNSYNSGDWFNRIDWSYTDNYFGTGAPQQADNGASWAVIKPLLLNAAIKPGAAQIVLARDMFRDLLKIRNSSTLFRLRTATDIRNRLKFYNTGSTQVATVVVGHLDGAGYTGAGFKEVLYVINVDKVAQSVTIDAEKNKAYTLHPVHAAIGAADARVAAGATYNTANGQFSVPPRSAVVFVVN